MESPPEIFQPAPRPQRIEYPVPGRLARMRALSRLLDNSISLPGGYRIGIDPLIGLIPGVGDLLTSTLSAWFIYDAARLGLPKRILFRMALNVAVESLLGFIPLVGDLVDAVWKANARNMRLVEQHYHPALPGRSARRLIGTFAALLILLYAAAFTSAYLAVRFVLSFF